MEVYTEDQMRAKLREQCSGDRQRFVADELGMSQSSISLVLAGKRGVSDAVAMKMGFKRSVVYTPVEETEH